MGTIVRAIFACLALCLRCCCSVSVAAATHVVETPLAHAAHRPSAASQQQQDEEEELIAWAAQVPHSQELGDSGSLKNERSFAGTSVVVGVKTNVVHNFAARQAIRQTWAQRERLQPFAVRVVFLGCASDLSSYRNESERVALQRAIALEKRVFGDLLTSELDCMDSYFTLVNKVVSYMRWVTDTVSPQAPSLEYVAVADDDVYVRVDGLVGLLMEENTPRTKFYAGYVWTSVPPTRDAAHKNHIAESAYPMATLPPFAGGPFYVLSTDLARFVAQNREDLRGLGANDDISIALWLLALQVRPRHIDEMAILRRTPCHTNAVVVADILPSAIRHLHQNEAQNRTICDGFLAAKAMRQHRSITPPDSFVKAHSTTELTASESNLTWKLQHHAETNTLNIQVTVSVGTTSVDYPYVPALERYQDALCARGANALQARMYVYVDDAFCQFHRRALSKFLDEAVAEEPNRLALLTLARHNLKRSNAEGAKVIALSRGARYARVLIECLFVEMYPSATILVLSDASASDTADVFVFSALDGDGTDEPLTSNLMMISGETWPIKGLDPRVILISTVDAVQHPKRLYIPVASTVFAESIRHSPLELLQPYPPTHRDPGNRQFCAYLYARCDRIRREYMFDLLNEIEPVDALGACQGTRKEPLPQRRRARYNEPFYTDDATALYRNYRFVIAFENTFDAVGYVTEKIVTAFLAGAVPIYYGHNASVKRLFNSRAFINCGDFESLPACARFVDRVHRSPEMYKAMRREPPVVNSSAFFEDFSWHPDVAAWGAKLNETGRLATRLRQLLETTINN